MDYFGQTCKECIDFLRYKKYNQFITVLGGNIEAAVSRDKDGMILHILFFASLVMGQIALQALLRFLEEFSKVLQIKIYTQR